MIRYIGSVLSLSLTLLMFALVPAVDAQQAKHVLVIAGKPSHPPRMHEFNAGVQLLAKSVQDRKDLKLDYALNGWPKDEAILDQVDAVIFYMDGGAGHEVGSEACRQRGWTWFHALCR
jgi:hypothetical protein